MKKFIIVLLSLFYIVSGIVFVDINVVEESVHQVIMGESSISYIEDFKEVFNLDPIYEMVPVEYKKEAEVLINKINDDKELNKIIKEQSTMALNDLVNGTMSFDEAATKEQLVGVVENYADDVERLTEGTVTKEEIVVQVEKHISGYNLVSTYEKVLIQVRGQLSESQLNSLKMFSTGLASMKLYSFIFMAIAIVLIVILSPANLVVSSILGALIMLINRYSLTIMFDFVLRKMGLNSSLFSLDFSYMTKAYLVLGVLFIIGIIGKMFKKNKETIQEYDLGH